MNNFRIITLILCISLTVLVGCTFQAQSTPSKEDSPVKQPLPNILVAPSEVILPGSNVKMKFVRDPKGVDWILECSREGVGTGVSTPNPPKALIVNCGFSLEGGFFTGGIIAVPNILRVEAQLDDGIKHQITPVQNFFGLVHPEARTVKQWRLIDQQGNVIQP